MKKKLHFIFYSELYKHGGGIETWASYFFPRLSQEEVQGYEEVIIYALKAKSDKETLTEELLKFNNIKVVCMDLGDVVTQNTIINYYRFLKEVKSSLKAHAEKQDTIISIGLLNSGFLLLDNYISKNYSFITWIRSKSVGEISTYKSKIYTYFAKLLEKTAVKNSDYIITNGDDTLHYYQNLFPKNKYKMSRIFNAIDLDNIPFEEQSRKLNTSKVYIAYTGRLSVAKGFTDFTEISKKVVAQNKNIVFNVYGDDSNYKKDILEEHINFKGKYQPNEANKILCENDVVIFLNRESQAGGVSHSLLEAMANGKLIVAWDNYTHNQVLNDSNSILVNEGDLLGLETALHDISNGKYDVELLCQNVQKDVKLYSVNQHIKAFNNILKHIEEWGK